MCKLNGDLWIHFVDEAHCIPSESNYNLHFVTDSVAT